MKKFPKRVLELFGENCYNDYSIPHLQELARIQQCKYTGQQCFKIRKSNPMVAIGSCVVGYAGNPLIICPWKFLSKNRLFLDIAKYFFQGSHQIAIVPELKFAGGVLDFVVTNIDRFGTPLDFIVLETQALDTTSSGAIWSSREDLLSGNVDSSYSYGINWRMSAKTILMQLYHKVPIIEEMNSKIVLAIQRPFFNYLSRVFDLSGVVDAEDAHPLQIFIYDLDRASFELVLFDRYSTDVKGIQKMMLPLRTSNYSSDIIKSLKDAIKSNNVFYINLS